MIKIKKHELSPYNLFLLPQLTTIESTKYIYTVTTYISTYYILYNYGYKCRVCYNTHVDNNNNKIAVKRLRWGVNEEGESDNQLQT